MTLDDRAGRTRSPKYALIRRLSWKKLVSYCEIFQVDLLGQRLCHKMSRSGEPCFLLTFSTIFIILPSYFTIALITLDCKWNFCLLSKLILTLSVLGSQMTARWNMFKLKFRKKFPSKSKNNRIISEVIEMVKSLNGFWKWFQQRRENMPPWQPWSTISNILQLYNWQV